MKIEASNDGKLQWLLFDLATRPASRILYLLICQCDVVAPDIEFDPFGTDNAAQNCARMNTDSHRHTLLAFGIEQSHS